MKKIRKYYSEGKFHSLIEAAEKEYNFLSSKNGVVYFETMFISILAIFLILIVELDLINGWLTKNNNGIKLEFESNLFVFRVVIGVIILFLITYRYFIWTVNQGHRDKKRKLKHFIQTMHLSKGMKMAKGK